MRNHPRTLPPIPARPYTAALRPLRLLLLIAILPGLLLPGGFVWRLCQCAAMSAPASCCVVEPRACCCQSSGASDGGSAQPRAESRPECTCGVIATPEKEPANEVLGTGTCSCSDFYCDGAGWTGWPGSTLDPYPKRIWCRV